MNEFEIDKKQVRRAFSRAAQDYDAAAVLQREVCTRMLERLGYIKLQPSRIIDVGSGTGWGTAGTCHRCGRVVRGVLRKVRHSSPTGADTRTSTLGIA